MSHRSIMVVDYDSALLAGLMQLHLPDIRVEAFESPRMALAHFEKKKVGGIVADFKMDEMDGFALLGRASAVRPNVPVILLSSHVDSAMASQAIRMGAQDVLRKPFSREEFVTALTRALNTFDVAREVRIRRAVIERLSKQVDDLKRLIARNHQRPNTIRRIQQQVRASGNGRLRASPSWKPRWTGSPNRLHSPKRG